MQQDLSLAPATARDIDALVALINRAYRGDTGWTRETDIVAGNRITTKAVTQLIGNPEAHLLTARQSARLVACVCVEATAEEAHIGTFAVDPELQNQGIGKQVLHAAERYAIEMLGVTRISMTVVSQRPELIAFYERHGYRRSGIVSAYPLHLDVGTPLHEGLTMERLEKVTKMVTHHPSATP